MSKYIEIVVGLIGSGTTEKDPPSTCGISSQCGHKVPSSQQRAAPPRGRRGRARRGGPVPGRRSPPRRTHSRKPTQTRSTHNASLRTHIYRRAHLTSTRQKEARIIELRRCRERQLPRARMARAPSKSPHHSPVGLRPCGRQARREVRNVGLRWDPLEPRVHLQHRVKEVLTPLLSLPPFVHTNKNKRLSVFSGAAGLLGLFNPFSWFAADVPSPPVSSGPRSPVRTYGGGVWSVSAELSAPQLRTRLFEKYIDPKWEQRRLNTPVKV